MKAIIFDFDGVIVDTYNLNMGLVKEVGYDVSHENFKANHDENCLEKPKIILSEESSNIFFDKYFENITEAKLFLTKENIRDFKKIGSLYIVSSSKEDSIKKFLKHNNIEFFDEILGANFHKSKVEKFKYLLKKYNLNSDEVVFISDTLGDVLEANQVNIKTIAVDYGFHDSDRIQKGNPYRIVSNFSELLKTVNEIKD
jgi:phosphoglycolate phosphatase